jgi:hypothetical protein
MAWSQRGVRGVVTAFLHDLGAPFREVADGEWGLVVDDVGGRPLEVGIRLCDGLLMAQAWVAPAGVVDPHRLLHGNRLRRLARYAHSAAGEVHVHVDVPLGVVDAEALDRMLAALVEAAGAARNS